MKHRPGTHPEAHTLHLNGTLNLTPYKSNPDEFKLQTLHLKAFTLNRKPSSPTPLALDPQLSALYLRGRRSLSPSPALCILCPGVMVHQISTQLQGSKIRVYAWNLGAKV